MDDVDTVRYELKKLLEDFIKDPNDPRIQKEAITLEKKYASLTTLNDYMSKNHVPKEIIQTLGILDKIYLFNSESCDEKNLIKDITLRLKSIS